MFQLEANQVEKLRVWREEQDAKVLASQKESRPGDTQPYYGAIGGAYSYTFTPTTLGLCVEVTNNLTKEKINLTNYEDW